jgi:hypothetical protein
MISMVAAMAVVQEDLLLVVASECGLSIEITQTAHARQLGWVLLR